MCLIKIHTLVEIPSWPGRWELPIAYEFPTDEPKFEVVSGTGGKGGGGGGGGGGVGGIGVRRKRQTSTRIVDKKAPKPSDLGEVPSSITTEYQVQK